MKRLEAWSNHAALAAVSLSGLAYGIFKYFVPSSDPDSRIGHPLQPAMLKAHILVAPLAVFTIGLIFRRHALARIRTGESNGRRSGALMLWLLLPLTVTGYLVQVFVETTAVRAAAWSHAGLGAAFLLGYALHPKQKAPTDTGSDEVNGENG
jgi:hypothetical protein